MNEIFELEKHSVDQTLSFYCPSGFHLNTREIYKNYISGERKRQYIYFIP